ncbi:Trehalose-phosphatase, partial [Phytophthora palmivora]
RELSRRDMTSAYSRTSRRLIFINYEGVLAAEASIPELAYPPQELIWQLSMLTKDPRNTVVLVSARSTSVCEQWFAGLSGNLVLAAEYGVYVKWVGENEYWHCMVPNMDMSWWEHVVPLLEYYTERTPGAYIERKESSVAWHYRDCDLDHGLWQASELLVSLREITRSLPVSVCPGNRYLEVRPQKASKATLFERVWEFMNWSSLFPDEDPVTTEYFGEAVHLLSSPMMKPRGFHNDPIDESDFPTLSLDGSAFRDAGSDFVHAGQTDSVRFSMDSDNLALGQLDGVDEKQPVDFVLVIASGDDRTDEDLFAVLVPPPIDLEAYCQQLEKDEFEDMPDRQQQQEGNLSTPDTEETSSSFTKRRNPIQDTTDSENGIGSSSFGDISDELSYNTFRRLMGRDGNSSSLAAGPGERGGLSSATSLARLPSLPSDTNFLVLGEKIAKLTPLAKSSISEGAANMFPVAMLNRSSIARRDEKSKFTPRRDFPPTAALFKAMKAKFGDNFGIHRLPETAAACWALVCPPTERAKLENGVGAPNNGESPASQTTSVSTDDAEDGRYRFPVNTFVCTLGRKLSQAPYFIKNSGDLFQLLQEMGMSSHIRKQRMLSMGSVGDI